MDGGDCFSIEQSDIHKVNDMNDDKKKITFFFFFFFFTKSYQSAKSYKFRLIIICNGQILNSPNLLI